MKIKLQIVFALTATVLLFSSDSFACACCADAGFYSISSRKPDNHELGELKKIKFGTANIYTTSAFPDNVKGINPLNESYTLDGLLQGNAWKFNFKDERDKSGTLNLTKPVSMVAYMADLHEAADNGSGVKLYKEWRFKYKVSSGAGIFQKGIAPATEYFLVLQGRGNACTSAADFSNWRLEIIGKKANYAFYGKLK
jgi:hypothetical protein